MLGVLDPEGVVVLVPVGTVGDAHLDVLAGEAGTDVEREVFLAMKSTSPSWSTPVGSMRVKEMDTRLGHHCSQEASMTGTS